MRILFVDKVMACICREPPRGVELFNIRLLQELSQQGIEVCALLHPSWIPYLEGAAIHCLHPQGSRLRDEIGPRQLLRAAKGMIFDVLLLGNVANRLVGFVIGARIKRLCRNCLVIAHREPSRRVLWGQKAWPKTIVVAVNQQIANHYRRSGFSRTSVYYGVTGADTYLDIPLPREGDIVNFCVVGNLENAWKGADTAIAAFRALPEDVRSRCRLHLASYHTMPSFPEENIVPYGWMSAEQIPAFLGKMHAMLVPSRDEHVMRETFSQVMVQGMLAGLPVVVSRLPILVEKLDEGGGIITDTVSEMAVAMQSLVVSRDLRRSMGAAAREVAEKRYVWRTDYFVQHFLCAK
jgi:glycosyltransferase involved in cell wall biosynthesis